MTEIIRAQLYDLQDIKYKDFHCKLIPTVDPDRVIGVRAPAMKALAKELAKTDVSDFLRDLPHKYYDEKESYFLVREIRFVWF